MISGAEENVPLISEEQESTVKREARKRRERAGQGLERRRRRKGRGRL